MCIRRRQACRYPRRAPAVDGCKRHRRSDKRNELREATVLGGIHGDSCGEQALQDRCSRFRHSARCSSVGGQVLHVVCGTKFDVCTPGEKQLHAVEMAKVSG